MWIGAERGGARGGYVKRRSKGGWRSEAMGLTLVCFYVINLEKCLYIYIYKGNFIYSCDLSALQQGSPC